MDIQKKIIELLRETASVIPEDIFDALKKALKGKAVYLSAIGGAGSLYAEKMKILNVYKKEFGMPEAIWEFEIIEFPVIVTMDAKGDSLYEDVLKKSKDVYLRKLK